MASFCLATTEISSEKQNGGRYPARDNLAYVGVDWTKTSTSIPDFFGVGCDPSYDLVAQSKFYSESRRLSDNVIPIARDIAGNLICIGVQPQGRGGCIFVGP